MKVYDVYFTCESIDYHTKESSITSSHESIWANNKIEAIQYILYFLWDWNNSAHLYGNYRIPMNMHCELN